MLRRHPIGLAWKILAIPLYRALLLFLRYELGADCTTTIQTTTSPKAPALLLWHASASSTHHHLHLLVFVLVENCGCIFLPLISFVSSDVEGGVIKIVLYDYGELR